ncbi:putative motility protein [Halothiobacillus diazotrophicus]|uniref:putative motility protein n=1 Tax=Halothiobacillus diazotrophicus TaxID=1860122 RepID=UPI0009EDDC80|nr:putative motility protein [Halothiobacillus diazotrophicus]
MSDSSLGIGALSQYATLNSQAQALQAAQMAMLKKSMDVQAQSVLPLINSFGTTSSSAANPPHLGNRIDTHA